MTLQQLGLNMAFSRNFKDKLNKKTRKTRNKKYPDN